VPLEACNSAWHVSLCAAAHLGARCAFLLWVVRFVAFFPLFLPMHSRSAPSFLGTGDCLNKTSKLGSAPCCWLSQRSLLRGNACVLTVYFSGCRHHEISAVGKDDFFAAFRMIAGGAGGITQDQVRDVLYEAMGAPPHEGPELDDFLALFEGMGNINMENFEDALDENNTKHAIRPAKQYVSVGKLKDDRVKHRRCEGASHEKMHAPVTSNQEYGWGKTDNNLEKAAPPCGKMFAHRPSFMSYYAESMVCYEEGRDLCAGPTMKAMEL